MVHSMDAMSNKWRDDPVRAINEKKAAREAQALVRSDAQARAARMLEQKLKQAQKGVEAREYEQAGAIDNDEEYRQEMEQRRRKLLEGGSDSDSSSSEVHDPFMSKCAPRQRG
eukprot:4465877-Prymnesium_polylepis.1